MPSDRSRSTDRPLYGYTGPVAQQGRVILDRDFNALQGLTADRIAADALDFVGPSGTPDDGFRVSLPSGSPPSPPFWSPPEGPQGSPPQAPGGHGDFLIAPGTMYVGGQRVTFPGEQNGKAITYSYLDQPDWPAPPLPSAEPTYELVYLDLTELEVSAVEDPDLLEVALGGPDTTQRLKLLRRVRRMKVAAANCAAAWDEAVNAWATAGWQFDPATMRLEPLARLKVAFANDASTNDPCDPVATGGYLGADNQLIRLRIAASSAGPRLVWGYDNASFLYRVTQPLSDPTSTTPTLTLAASPPDAFHVPQTGQLVEVLSTAAMLGEEPDETDPTGKRQILRVAADADGTLCTVKSVTSDGTTTSITLTAALPPTIANSTLPLFVRVWQGELPLAAGGGTVTIADPPTMTNSVSTGVTATISSAVAGRTLADGAFWQIAVRPATPQGAYPEDLLVAPQPPDGPRRWACPLAVISWTQTGGTVTDCRNVFDDLVALTRRKPGCCTVSIAPGDITAATSLQTLLDRAAARAATVTVCLSPGQYALPGTLYLDRRHSNMTLESCGGPAILLSQKLADLTPFSDGLVVVEGASGVTMRGLTLRPPLVLSTVKLFDELLARLKKDGFDQTAQAFRRPYTSFGLRVVDAVGLTLDDCVIQIEPNDASTAADRLIVTADLFVAAVFVQGNCSALKIKDCAATSTIAPTYNKLEVKAAAASPNNLKIFNDLLAFHLPDFSEQVPVPASPPASPAPPPPPPPSPPPASPPVSEEILLDKRISDALDFVAAKRIAVDLAAPKFVIVTVGVLAAGSLDGICQLGEAAVHRSEFDGFTFATWFSSAMAILRLEDNTINNGVAGLWLEVIGAINPVGALVKPAYYQQMTLFEEYQLLLVLAATFPRPTPPVAPPATRINIDAEILAAAAPFSLLVTGNQVDVRQQTATVSASAAMMLALYRDRIAQPLTSVIISANRLCGGMAAVPTEQVAGAAPQVTSEVPAVEVTLTKGTPCSITGNAVINRGDIAAAGTANAVGPSLWLEVSEADGGVSQLAVTGNVLHGISDLAQIRRKSRQDTWSFYNADPS